MDEVNGESRPDRSGRLQRLVSLIAHDRDAPTTVTAEDEVWKVHIADSRSGLEFEELKSARRVCDVGSGAGFPGLVLAAELPETQVDLVESVGRKCAFLERAIDVMGLRNARVICGRSESWAAADGRELYDVVTARAVGRLATLAELASPLLVEGGCLIAWKGRRDLDEELEVGRAVARTAVEPIEVRAVGPYAGSRHRHLHLLRKIGPTPNDLPRRSGMAKKRPFGSER